MSQPPSGYYPGQQPPGQPWINQPPTGYPASGQAGGPPPPGYRGPQGPPPQGPRGKRSRKFNAVLIAIIAIFAIIAIGIANNSSKSTKSAATTASLAAKAKASLTASRASAAAKLLAKDAAACDSRPPASGGIYVRTLTPGASAQARELSGKWHWDRASKKCLTAVQLTIAAAPLSAGDCTQVGYADDNPGYDVTAAAAPALTEVAAQAGPACQAAAPAPTTAQPVQTTTVPVQTTAQPVQTAAAAPTTAAPAPVPPASSAPASCSPISDEGTCYEPGEYCRDDDHGTSGVAGDGKAITCEDNDGWRWEPV